MYNIIIYKAVILPVVLYRCDTWSLTLRVEYRLGMFDKKGTEENIWTEEGWSDGRVEKTT
jgi:hypothetical protein